MSIYGVDGRKILTLASGLKAAGAYQMVWEGRDDHGSAVASGIFFSRFEAGEFSENRKMVLMK